MFSKTHLALLASAILSANGALAANHRHAQRHLHLNDKKDIVPETTTTVTDVIWTTVYVDADEATETSYSAAAFVEASTTSSSSSSIASSSSTSFTSVAPTTLLTSTSAAFVTPNAAAAVEETTTSPTETATPTTTDNVISDIASAATSVVAEVTSAAAAVASAVTSSSSTGKRGAAYNDAGLVSLLLGTDSKIGWAYNWGSSSDSLTSDLEFVPMLWGEKTVSYWATNAQAAIDAGSKYLLGPNEPDNAAQANMDPATAATFHMTNMEPFASSAKLTAPAVTNSNVAGESIDWLNEFISACSECTFSVCPVHWYNTIEAGAEDLFDFLVKAGDACGSDRTVWLTEFAPNVDSPSAAQISSFLETVQDTLDNNATFSFVERYSYFYVAEGSLISGGAVSSYGSTFAFGS